MFLNLSSVSQRYTSKVGPTDFPKILSHVLLPDLTYLIVLVFSFGDILYQNVYINDFRISLTQLDMIDLFKQISVQDIIEGEKVSGNGLF